MNKSYWLMKSEPDVFGIHDLKKAGTTHWDGVRNYQARNHIRQMRRGDGVLFYHSSSSPSGVAGIAEISKEAYPDFTAFDSKGEHYDPKSVSSNPSWFMVDVKFVREARELVPAARLKTIPGLENMVLFKAPRLSVQPVTPAEWRLITGLPEFR